MEILPKKKKQKAGAITSHVRRMIITKDMPEVLDIEQQSFKFPWAEESFIRRLRQRSKCIGMIAEHEDRVKGFAIFKLHKNRIHVLNFAVAADCCRRGVGSQMVAKLISKLSFQHRTRIVLEICETNLPAQLFFRENGFRAVSVLRGYYDEYTSEDAYLMQYRLQPEESAFPLCNRISWLVD